MASQQRIIIFLFKKNITRSEAKQREQVPQIIWLLQSTQDYFSQENVKVKVFCKP